MSTIDPLPPELTSDDVSGLEAGRRGPLRRRADSTVTMRSRRRPTLGGGTFVRTLVTARVLGRLHPRLARRALLRLWLTPWVHPSTRRPVTDLPEGLRAWALPHGAETLHGVTGGAGPTAVLVHGWAGRGADWRHLAGDLIGAGWRVVVPDLPAHGATTGATTDVFALGAAVGAVVRHERPTAVITHSLGFPATLQALEQGADEPEILVALAPGRQMRRALERFAAQAALSERLKRELDSAIRGRFGDDIWEVLDVDRVVPDLASRGAVIHDHDDADVPITDGAHIAADWPAATFFATRGLGHRRILRDDHVRGLVVAALA